jgi:prepilin-type N-terminal cleavage/methylation domain-containing protein
LRRGRRLSSRPSLHGFTLVELLVVVAIIALLLAILAPSVQRAADLARAAVCMSNQRSCGAAFFAYAMDHGGILAYKLTLDVDAIPGANHNYGWINLLSGKIPGENLSPGSPAPKGGYLPPGGEVAICPLLGPDEGHIWRGNVFGFWRGTRDWGLNDYSETPFVSPWPVEEVTYEGYPAYMEWVHMWKVPRTSDFLLLADATRRDQGRLGTSSASFSPNGGHAGSLGEVYFGHPSQHAAGMLADGHVESMTIQRGQQIHNMLNRYAVLEDDWTITLYPPP